MLYDFGEGIHVARNIDLGEGRPKFQFVLDESGGIQIVFGTYNRMGAIQYHVVRLKLTDFRILVEEIERTAERLQEAISIVEPASLKGCEQKCKKEQCDYR